MNKLSSFAQPTASSLTTPPRPSAISLPTFWKSNTEDVCAESNASGHNRELWLPKEAQAALKLQKRFVIGAPQGLAFGDFAPCTSVLEASTSHENKT